MIKLISEPLYSIILILITGIFTYIIYHFKKPTDKFFLWNELILLIIGVFSILSIVAANQTQRNEIKNNELEHWIQIDFKLLIEHLNENYYCFKYTKSDILTDKELNRRQKCRDEICEWIKTINFNLTKKNNSYKLVPEFPKVSQETKNEYLKDITDLENERKSINKLINEHNELAKYERKSILNEIYNTFGLIILMISFGIKLSEIIYKINNT